MSLADMIVGQRNTIIDLSAQLSAVTAERDNWRTGAENLGATVAKYLLERDAARADIKRLHKMVVDCAKGRDEAIQRAEKADHNQSETAKYVEFCLSDIGALAAQNEELRQCLENMAHLVNEANIICEGELFGEMKDFQQVFQESKACILRPIPASVAQTKARWQAAAAKEAYVKQQSAIWMRQWEPRVVEGWEKEYDNNNRCEAAHE